MAQHHLGQTSLCPHLHHHPDLYLETLVYNLVLSYSPCLRQWNHSPCFLHVPWRALRVLGRPTRCTFGVAFRVAHFRAMERSNFFVPPPSHRNANDNYLCNCIGIRTTFDAFCIFPVVLQGFSDVLRQEHCVLRSLVRISLPSNDPILICLLTDTAKQITIFSASVSALEPVWLLSASPWLRFEASPMSCNKHVLCGAFPCHRTIQRLSASSETLQR